MTVAFLLCSYSTIDKTLLIFQQLKFKFLFIFKVAISLGVVSNDNDWYSSHLNHVAKPKFHFVSDPVGSQVPKHLAKQAEQELQKELWDSAMITGIHDYSKLQMRP